MALSILDAEAMLDETLDVAEDTAEDAGLTKEEASELMLLDVFSCGT